MSNREAIAINDESGLLTSVGGHKNNREAIAINDESGLLLAIDTATLTAGVGLSRNGVLVATRRRVVTVHSDALLALIDETLAAVGARPADLAAIVCGAGPGSFTGLRIGLATAKGLCFALARPLVMISSLEALAARVPDGPVAAVLDAHRGEVYAGLYFVSGGVPRPDGHDGHDHERVLAPAQLAEELAHAPRALLGEGALHYRALFGEGALRYRALFGAAAFVDEDGSPRPEELLRLGAARLATVGASDLASSEPRYLRPSEAERMKLQR